ncbi:unnamed protein product [Amoebophrya sp. A120]|nr:unnamed protein product [Amoebophrya sp. A120]|eukprot:GSA120T00009903001.1
MSFRNLTQQINAPNQHQQGPGAGGGNSTLFSPKGQHQQQNFSYQHQRGTTPNLAPSGGPVSTTPDLLGLSSNNHVGHHSSNNNFGAATTTHNFTAGGSSSSTAARPFSTSGGQLLQGASSHSCGAASYHLQAPPTGGVLPGASGTTPGGSFPQHPVINAQQHHAMAQVAHSNNLHSFSAGTAQSTTHQQSTSSTSNYERNIKSIIERLQEEARLAREELLSTSITSQMIGYQGEYKPKEVAFKDFLLNSKGLIEDGRSLFRDWQVSLAGERLARNKKLSVEKLQLAFEEEVHNMQIVQRQVQNSLDEFEHRMLHSKNVAKSTDGGGGNSAGGTTAGTTANSTTSLDPTTGLQVRNRGAAQNELGNPNDRTGGAFSYLQQAQQLEQQQRYLQEQEDANMNSRIAQERQQGIQRIVGQVGEVQKIFKDLATVVTDQGEQILNIEHYLQDTSDNVYAGTSEIDRLNREKKKKETRRNCLLLVLSVLGLGILLYWAGCCPSVYGASAASTSAGTTTTSGASGPPAANFPPPSRTSLANVGSGSSSSVAQQLPGGELPPESVSLGVVTKERVVTPGNYAAGDVEQRHGPYGKSGRNSGDGRSTGSGSHHAHGGSGSTSRGTSHEQEELQERAAMQDANRRHRDHSHEH